MSDKVLLYVTSDNCPSCDDLRPIVQKIAKEFNLKFVEKNSDHDKTYKFIIYKYGLVFYDDENGWVYPTPQIFLVLDNGIHYVLDPEGGTPEAVENVTKKRIKLLLEDKVHWGRIFLHNDLKDFVDPERNFTGFDFYYLAKPDMPRIKMFNKIFAIDLERFTQLINNNFNCLCVKGWKCPCKPTRLVGKCVCGVFYLVPSRLGVTNQDFYIELDEKTKLKINPRELEKFLQSDPKKITKPAFLLKFKARQKNDKS